MVAVALLAIGIVPLLATHAATIRAFTRSKEITQASFLASSQLGILEARDPEEENLPAPAEGEDEDRPYIHWQSEVAAEGENLARADVSVQFDAARGKAAALSTYLVKLRFKEEEEKKAEE